MSHKHNVYEADPHFSIDSVTKKIKNGSTQKTRLIQGDHNSECFGFVLERYVEWHDMMLCDTVMIHYINVDSATRAENKGVYEVRDLQVNPNDKNKVVFSWTITENVTLYAGPLSFLIKFMCTENGETVYRWNTDINSEISISNGMSNDETITELFPDILAQWHDEIFGDAENAVANINLAEQDALANVRAEGLKQVSDIQKVVEPIQASVDQIYKNHKNKASVIEGTAEGNIILLDDSAEQPFIGLRVFGRSEQEKNSGKQMIPFPYYESTKTVQGVTCTVNDDGSVTFSGTATGKEAFRYVMYMPLKAGTYTFSYSGEFTGNNIWIVNATNSSAVAIIFIGNENYPERKITFTVNEDIEKVYITANWNAGQTVSGTLYLMLNEGENALPYEKYTGGVAIPSPENPSEIVSVENPEVDVWGKNLLKPKARTETINGVTFTVKDDGTVIANGTATKATFFGIGPDLTLTPNERYVLSGCPEGGGFDTYMIYLHYKDSGLDVYNRLDETSFVARNETFSSVVVVYEGITVNNLVFRPMIRFATIENGDFEPYKEQNLSIPYTLHGIQTGSGMICDEIDLERGVLIQRIGSYTITGDEDWYLSGLQNLASEGIYRYDANYVSQNSSPVSNAMSTHYPYPTKINLEKGCWVLNDATQNLALRIMWNYATVDDLKAFLKEQYEQNMPVVVNYILAEPIETALSEAEISAFKSLLSNYPTTTILTDSGANMAVRYGVDTKLYIDKKFAELMSLHE